MALQRRELLLAALALPGLAEAAPDGEFERRMTALEVAMGGELGLCALDSGTGRQLAHRAEQRFAMCSTFKALLAACVMARIETGILALDQWVPIASSDLVPYAPAVSAHLPQGHMTLRALCQACVEISDNAAANLLLARVGGPAGLTRWLRGLGDELTRLDRIEPELNSNIPDDPRDSTTPAAMARSLGQVLVGEALAPASRAQLLAWMEASQTGLARLRAGLPAGWRCGDKTGTGTRGAVNDVAIVLPPGRAPWLVALYLSGSSRPTAELNRQHEQVMRAIVAAWT